MRFRTRAVSVVVLAMALLPTVGGVAFAQLVPTDPNIIVLDGPASCNGLLPTPGSQNTIKTLTGGSLVPGGDATFLIRYPVDEGNAGEWVVQDCVLIGTGDNLKDYDVLDKATFKGVSNAQFFEVEFTVDIPADTPVGTSICNVAKTTSTPSEPQSSNRKAGPSCFVVGGSARVEKQNPEGEILFGATFEIHDCVNNAVDPLLQPIIVNPTPAGGGPEGTVVADEGFISFNGPSGSTCLITEVTPPDGYTLPPLNERTKLVTIPVGVGDAVTIVFVDTPIVPAEPAMQVTKRCQGTGQIGETITYTITLTNTGTDTLTIIAVGDILLGEITHLFPETLAPGETVVVEVERTILPTDPDPLPNEVEVIAQGIESGVTIRDAADCHTDIEQQPGISAAKSCSGPAVVGQEVTYTISIENTGDEMLVDITVLDSLLGDVTAAFPASLAIGQTVTKEFTRTVLPTDPDILENIVTVTAVGKNSLLVVSDEAACTTDVLRPVIAIEKTGATLAHVGDTVDYIMTVTNPGNTPLSNVVVSDPLCDAAPVRLSGDVNSDGLLDLAETWTYTCSHKIVAADGDPVENTASVTGTSGTHTVSDSDDHVVDIIAPEISLSKRVTPRSAGGGTGLRYILDVTNTGDTPLFDVVLTDDRCGEDVFWLIPDAFGPGLGDGHISPTGPLLGPYLMGAPIKTIASGALEPGQMWRFTCASIMPTNAAGIAGTGVAGGGDVVNEATVQGTDVLGKTVSAEADALVLPVLGTTGSQGVGNVAGLGALFLLSGLVFNIGSRRRGRFQLIGDGRQAAMIVLSQVMGYRTISRGRRFRSHRMMGRRWNQPQRS